MYVHQLLTAQSGQPPLDGAVMRQRCRLQTADIRHAGIGFIRWAAHVQCNVKMWLTTITVAGGQDS